MSQKIELTGTSTPSAGTRILYTIALIAGIGFSFGACGDGSGSRGDQGTAPAITTASLPNGTVGTAYNQTLTAAGDTPVIWSIESGDLPDGLRLEADAIKGTPTTARKFDFTVKATNAAGNDIKQLTITIAGSIEMVQIQGGIFTMGSPTGEANRYADETPHQVTLTGFYMGKYEVTQTQYKELMGENPSYFTTPVSPETSTGNRPVESVTWYDAVEFCNKLSTKDGLTPVYTITDRVLTEGSITEAEVTANWDTNGYRLPTEAQWEYACRAGTTTAYNTGASINNNTGWYKNNSNNRTHTVGEKPANPWGLHDMHGNVYEWCWDWYSSNYYSSSPAQNPTGPVSGANWVDRGGSCVSEGRDLRSAYRDYFDDISAVIGFRVVRP